MGNKSNLLYRRYQNKNGKSAANGKWYGRLVINHTVGLEELAAEMQENCTVKRSDILAVLTELGQTMKSILQDGKRVKVNGLGSFKMGMSTEGVTRRDDFNIGLHLKQLRVLFQPESYKTSSGTRAKEWTTGVVFTELPAYDGAKPQTNAPAGV